MNVYIYICYLKQNAVSMECDVNVDNTISLCKCQAQFTKRHASCAPQSRLTPPNPRALPSRLRDLMGQLGPASTHLHHLYPLLAFFNKMWTQNLDPYHDQNKNNSRNPTWNPKMGQNGTSPLNGTSTSISLTQTHWSSLQQTKLQGSLVALVPRPGRRAGYRTLGIVTDPLKMGVHILSPWFKVYQIPNYQDASWGVGLAYPQCLACLAVPTVPFVVQP